MTPLARPAIQWLVRQGRAIPHSIGRNELAIAQFRARAGGPKRLTVSWKGSWKNFSVHLDGRSVLTIPTWKELKGGREVRLEPGMLAVRLKRAFLGPALLLSLNGRPLPQSGGDPLTRLATAYNTIYFVGGLSIVIGLLTVFLRSTPERDGLRLVDGR